MSKAALLIINVVIPMLIGGFTYIFFREPTLLMFKWFDYINISDFIFYIREEYLFNLSVPSWIAYNFPDGIWIYSLTSLMIIIWREHHSNVKYFWFSLGPLLGISAEIGQYFSIVNGTFDEIDFIFCILGSILPFFLLLRWRYYFLGNK